MKIAYISDLHIDFYIKSIDTNTPKFKRELQNYIDIYLAPKPADVLIIAGDIGHYNNQSLAVLKELKTHYKEVLVTFGNHELYLISKSIQKKYKYNSLNRLNEFKQMLQENDIKVLDGNVYEFDCIKIGGCPMWYNVSNDDEVWKEQSNDSRLIMSRLEPYYIDYGWGGKDFKPTFDTESYYKSEINKIKLIKECDIFVSHVPCDIVNDEKYLGSEANKLYHSDNLNELKRMKVKYHIFGHIHSSINFKKDGVEFICNPLCYPNESYNEISVLEV